MELSFKEIDLKEEASAREKIYFIIILALILVSFTRWLYIPKLGDIKLAKVGISNLNLQIDTLKKFEALTALKPLSPEVSTDMRSDQILQSGRKVKDALLNDAVMAMSTQKILKGVSLVSLTIAPDMDKGSYLKIPITLSLAGSFTAVSHYLSQLEKLEIPLIIDNIELTTEGSEPSSLDAKLYVGVYVVK